MGDHHVLSLQSHVVSGYVGNKAGILLEFRLKLTVS
jgi:pyridoxal/pyridoxine/pyridoxamine kinase